MHAKQRESGRIIIVVLITVFTLSAFWFIALGVTGSELRVVGGKKSAAQQFYDAEAGVVAVVNSFDANLPTSPSAAPVSNATISDGARAVAQVTVRPVRDDAGYAATHNLPQQNFEFDPPEGSGSGVNTSIAQRYVITSAAGDRVIQVGVYQVVPR